MKRTLNYLAILALLGGQAQAATLSVTPGSGATLGQGVDGSGNLLNASVICGASATVTLYAACVNQAIVNTSGQLLVLATQSGTWTVAVSGGVTINGPLGAGAESAGVAVSLSGTKTTASPALPTGGAGGIGWLSDIDANVQAGFETATTSSRVIPASNVTPIDCSGTATGTPGNVTGLGITTIHGFTIQNQSASVTLGVSFVGTASIGSPGTFTLLPTGQSPNSYTTPVGFGSNHSVSVVAASSDVYSCVAF